MQPFLSSSLLAVAAVRHRVASRLLDACDDWWQGPALVLVASALAAVTVWMIRRDAGGLPRRVAAAIGLLRMAALAAVAAALLDVQRIAEHEIDLPSRVAVLVDGSASMALPEAADRRGSRADAAAEFVATHLLAALRPRHEVAVWRFDAAAEPVLRLPEADTAEGDAGGVDATIAGLGGLLVASGDETRVGEAVVRAVEGGPAGTLAGVVVVSDGGQNAGLDPRSAAASAARLGVPVHVVGVGGETLPANVRVVDVAAPARVFPGDRFTVAGFLQADGLAGTQVRVELDERAGDGGAPRTIDTRDVALAADGDLVAVRFEVPGLATAGHRMLAVRVVPPPGDHTAADDAQAVDVEVVDRVTQVLLMAGGPCREYQFMRNVLDRDRSFAVDVLLGTATAGISQDARRILDAFPPADGPLGEYDALVAIDYDWRRLDPAAQARLERWVATESGGLVLVAGGVSMDGWLDDPRSAVIRGLHPLELRRRAASAGGGAEREPRRLDFTRDGAAAEFLQLAATPAASAAVWREFAGVHACQPSAGAKPGATVLARLAAPAGDGPIYLAGQFFGSGSVLAVGSGELWRLRELGDAAYERLVAQIVRHVSQGRLLRGARRGRLIVEQDRVTVGGTVRFRLVAAGGTRPVCHAIAPDGGRMPLDLTEDPARPGTLAGSFMAAREGGWRIEVEPLAVGDEPIARRIQARLPDRELASPRPDRGMLRQLAAATGGTEAFLADGRGAGDQAAAIAAALPDRSRREYETGAADAAFKRRLNTVILGLGVGCLALEWIVRRIARLA
ncbi:MAG: hypothetical protein ACKO4T_13965 [Planctomycetaceae bacterium]